MVDFINLAINSDDIIYDGKVKMTYGGQGIIRIKDNLLGKRAYVIFPIHRMDVEDGVIVAVDEILNKHNRRDRHQKPMVIHMAHVCE